MMLHLLQLWFQNIQGRERAGYYNTNYFWGTGEAVTTTKGLGKY